jgi:F-type H+-transporting ATPase subunit gamma
MAANLKEVRERIRSVINTQQITKAMKMVSAAKLRKAQTAIQDMRPYADKLNQMLRNILSNLEGEANISFGEEREVKRACVVVVTSNRGLCGAFNSNVVKSAIATIEGELAPLRAEGNLSILCVGKKGYDTLKKRYTDIQINTDHLTLFDNLNFETISAVSQHLMDAFAKGDYDKVYVSYGQFRNPAVQVPYTEQFLPVPKVESEEDDNSGHKADYVFEPDMQGLLEYLVPSILHNTFQKYVLDTHASEHGARMTAMDSATENANELLRDLRISYNKARQEAITKEISEIVGGAAALEGS